MFRGWGWELRAVVLKLTLKGSDHITLTVSSAVNPQFPGWFVPIPGVQLSEVCKIKQLRSWLQSGHHVVNFCRVEVSVSVKPLKGRDSVALEKALKTFAFVE